MSLAFSRWLLDSPELYLKSTIVLQKPFCRVATFLLGCLFFSLTCEAQDIRPAPTKAGEAIAKLPTIEPRTISYNDDRLFLSSVAGILKPNGLFVIYNFCPAKAPLDKPYVPWSEGESPFSKEDFRTAGFEVLHFDVKDDVEARRLAKALQWDTKGGMNLEDNLFAWYTIVRKKPSSD